MLRQRTSSLILTLEMVPKKPMSSTVPTSTFRIGLQASYSKKISRNHVSSNVTIWMLKKIQMLC